MKTITIKANESFINEMLEMVKKLATKNQAKITIEQSEVYDPIKDEILADLESYRNGELEFISLDELEQRAKKWL